MDSEIENHYIASEIDTDGQNSSCGLTILAGSLADNDDIEDQIFFEDFEEKIELETNKESLNFLKNLQEKKNLIESCRKLKESCKRYKENKRKNQEILNYNRKEEFKEIQREIIRLKKRKFEQINEIQDDKMEEEIVFTSKLKKLRV